MQNRLAVILLVLVILPSALLSMLASRALRGRELVLEQRLGLAARNAIQAVSSHVMSDAANDMRQVTAEMAASLARGGRIEDIRAGADRVSRQSRTIGEVYVFLNPWGFVYPEGGPPTVNVDVRGESPSSAETRSGQEAALVAALREAIASSRSSVGDVKFVLGGSAYCFSRIAEEQGLYAGYETDPRAFAARLGKWIEDASGGGFVLAPSAPGLPDFLPGRPATGSLIISDSLSAPEEHAGESEEAPIALGRLPKPFDFLALHAYPADPDGIRRTGRTQSRLYRWGIVLLACGITAGAGLVLREAALEIRRARERSEFVVGVSHDLRTPVSSMKMLAESLYLEHVRDPRQQKRFLSTIVRECERLSQLIERVLFFVRFGQNALTYCLAEVHAGHMVESVIHSFRARFEGGRHGGEQPGPPIECSVEPDLATVRVDETAMSQVLLNLLDNAVKYGGGGGRGPIEVRVGMAQGGRRGLAPKKQWVCIAVEDHGIGIERRDLRRIFRRFYRVASSEGENVSGLGLGLALCRHVVTAHGGRIEAESAPGEGSVFTIYLPVAGRAGQGVTQPAQRDEV